MKSKTTHDLAISKQQISNSTLISAHDSLSLGLKESSLSVRMFQEFFGSKCARNHIFIDDHAVARLCCSNSFLFLVSSQTRIYTHFISSSTPDSSFLSFERKTSPVSRWNAQQPRSRQIHKLKFVAHHSNTCIHSHNAPLYFKWPPFVHTLTRASVSAEHPTLAKCKTLPNSNVKTFVFPIWSDTQTDVLVGFPTSATCVQKFDDSRILQIAILIAVCYVLHRCGSQDIPRYGLYDVIVFSFQCFSSWSLFPTAVRFIKTQAAIYLKTTRISTFFISNPFLLSIAVLAYTL